MHPRCTVQMFAESVENRAILSRHDSNDISGSVVAQLSTTIHQHLVFLSHYAHPRKARPRPRVSLSTTKASKLPFPVRRRSSYRSDNRNTPNSSPLRRSIFPPRGRISVLYFVYSLRSTSPAHSPVSTYLKRFRDDSDRVRANMINALSVELRLRSQDAAKDGRFAISSGRRRSDT